MPGYIGQDILKYIKTHVLNGLLLLLLMAVTRTDQCEKEKDIKITIDRQTLIRDNTIEKSRI